MAIGLLKRGLTKTSIKGGSNRVGAITVLTRIVICIHLVDVQLALTSAEIFVAGGEFADEVVTAERET